MKKILYEDRLKGGVDAKNLTRYLNRFDPKEVKMGTEHEKEHTSNSKIAAEIASDHLHDEPHYYSKLKAAKIESIFDFDFFDILESDEEDVPLGAKVKPLDLTTKSISKEEPEKTIAPHQTVRQKAAKGHALRLAQRATEREKYKAEYTKMGKSPEETETLLATTFDTQKMKGGRPRTGDTNKYRLGLLGKKSFPGKPNETPPSWASSKESPVGSDRTPLRTKIAQEPSSKTKKREPVSGTRTNMFRSLSPEGTADKLPFRTIKGRLPKQNSYWDVHTFDKPKVQAEPLKAKKTDPSYGKHGRNMSYQQIFKNG